MKYITWAIFIFYAIIVVVFSLMPGAGPPTGYDKVVHFGAFAVFAVLLANASKNITITVMVSVLVAAATEILQGQFGRDMSFFDWLANVSGIFVAMFFYGVLRK